MNKAARQQKPGIISPLLKFSTTRACAPIFPSHAPAPRARRDHFASLNEALAPNSRFLDDPLTAQPYALRVLCKKAKGGAAVAGDMIGYEQLVQDAMRGVMRAALQQAAGPRGLPGKHHFYITFKTHAPGVIIPDHMRARYPEDMTIVLEHQFWDLEVYQDRFRVILKFAGHPHPITIPFMAVARFYDPSVKFVLHFEQHSEEARLAAGDVPAHAQSQPQAQAQSPAQPVEDEAAPQAGAVVSLDAFRKK